MVTAGGGRVRTDPATGAGSPGSLPVYSGCLRIVATSHDARRSVESGVTAGISMYSGQFTLTEGEGAELHETTP
jgi:hypothetical protein